MATRHAGLCLLLAACGGSVTVGPPAVSPAPATIRHERSREPIDVLAALADTTRDVAWIIPGSAQLELGGAPVQAPDGAEPLEVVPLDERGNDIRVGVRLDHVRFAIWTQRARLLAIVLRDQRVEERPGGGFTPFSIQPIEARLRATALVRRIAHQKTWTKIRYSGALEINGWIPDDALTDHTRAGKQPIGRIPTGRTTLAVFPGAVIRAERRRAVRASTQAKAAIPSATSSARARSRSRRRTPGGSRSHSKRHGARLHLLRVAPQRENSRLVAYNERL